MTKKRKAGDSFERLARRISREGHLQKNSKGSQYVALVLTISMLTEISSCPLVKEATGMVSRLGVGLAAVLVQPVRALGVNCATCTMRTIAGTTEMTQPATGATTVSPANFQQTAGQRQPFN